MNARKSYSKPLRRIGVVHVREDGSGSATPYEAESLRAALHMHAESLSYATDERIIIGNVMSIDAEPGTFVAVELPDVVQSPR